MFESPATYQIGLTFYYRGPEWAIAVREGDLTALMWALERCSTFWNGASTLIVPVRSDGRTWTTVLDYLDKRAVDTCFVHNSVSESAQNRLVKKLGTKRVRTWARAWNEFADDELHPLYLQQVETDPSLRRTLHVPRFNSKSMQRILTATWGYLPPADLPHYRPYFNINEIDQGADAQYAMLAGQLNGMSPLEQSLNLIDTYGSLPIGRSLFVLESGSFRELVAFWNLRGRTRDIRNRPLVFGLPRRALQNSESLAELPRFISRDNFYAQEPDIGLIANHSRAQAQSALEELASKQMPAPRSNDPSEEVEAIGR